YDNQLHSFPTRRSSDLGKEIDLSQYKGKKMLLVNTASKCGYTPQYEDLEKLYKQYKDKLVIIGFPANNFAEQEPGSNDEIADFRSEEHTSELQSRFDLV